MRIAIIAAAGLAICFSCTSCNEGKNPLTVLAKTHAPGEIDPLVDYTKIGSCYGPTSDWKSEVDPDTHEKGRVCSIEVESLKEEGESHENYGKCDYSQSDFPEPKVGEAGYHDPVQLYIDKGDHVYFWSKLTLADGFRVRRLVRTTYNTNQACVQHPFRHEFKKNGAFVPNDNSRVPKPNKDQDCDYKLEVQIRTKGPGNKPDPDDHNKQYLCLDPHIRLNKGTNSVEALK